MEELTHNLGAREFFSSAATAIGPYHIQAGLPNQDAYDLITTDDFITLAVADGAGSLARSDEGSELAVEVAAGMAADLLLDSKRNGTTPDLPKILAESILEARSAMFTLDYWREAGCTLVLAVLLEESFAVAVIGDSFSVVQQSNGKLTLIQPPSVGEFANITKLLTSNEATVSVCSGLTSDLKGLALCSDAFEHSTLEQRVPTAGFWGTVFTMASKGNLKADELIGFMDKQGKIEDDATLIAIAPTVQTETIQSSDSSLTMSEYSLDEFEVLAGIGKANSDLNSEPKAYETESIGSSEKLPIRSVDSNADSEYSENLNNESKAKGSWKDDWRGLESKDSRGIPRNVADSF